MTSFTATPQQVERVVAAVLPHASDDGHMPLITCLNLEITADRLIVVATDRFTLAAAWAEFSDWSDDAEPAEPITARVYAADLRRVLSFLKPHRKIKATWTLTAERLTVALDDGQESITVRTVDIEWVKWRTVMGGVIEKAGDPAALIGLAPVHLAKFLASAKALGENYAAMQWHMGSALKPPIIHIGRRFVGMIMPVRLDDAPQLDLSALGIETSASAVAA